ncbi:MAG: peptidylprolyl isomerase [Bacteroidota bacterium]
MKKILTSLVILIAFSGIVFAQTSTQTEPVYLIKTSLGNIKVKLYNETPKHRDNFMKLVKEGFYNGSIFHRVINQFMIQGGGAKNGTEDVGYTVPAEFNSKFIHKKGALAAARMPDQINPQKESSGSQFYIVQGKKYGDSELDAIEQRLNKKFSPEAREMYKTVGGTPFLDGDYTVFGEVTEGMDVIDKIAAVKTATGDKPIEDIKMTIEEVK